MFHSASSLRAVFDTDITKTFPTKVKTAQCGDEAGDEVKLIDRT